ncbi:MAG: hypothetical protein P8L45_06010 [Longimicrobiales bacterium]|nr:hypothetical protein [Longimicrobiales bacterium]
MPQRHTSLLFIAPAVRAATTMLVSAGLFLSPSALTAQAPAASVQLAGALQAAPAMERDKATVFGFLEDGSMTTLQEGGGALICLADDPTRDGWNVACYHESLDPFMARGRELRAQGVTDAGELAQRRWAEADAGTLLMPEVPATLYVLTGDGFNADTNTVENSAIRWVVYTPWATSESTGLSAQPTAPGAPWLMFPGTAGAHIMITPATPGAGN